MSDQSSFAESSDDMNQSSSSSSVSGQCHAFTETFANLAQGAKIYRKPSVHPSQGGETNPYSPIQRGLVEYDITRDDRISNQDTPMPR